MTSLTLEAVMRRVAADKILKLSEAELRCLLSLPEPSFESSRLLTAHYFVTAQYEEAVPQARLAFQFHKNEETFRNFISCLLRAKKFAEGLALLKSEDFLDPCEQADMQCQIRYGMDDRDGAISEAEKSLRLKDALTPEIDLPEARIATFDPTQPDRNIIAFSVFGSDWRYLKGAVNNAIVIRYLYPGWRPRFYVDDSVPAETIQTLLREGAQVRKAPDLPAVDYGTFWRFLVEEDPEVDLYLIRDADSVVNVRERAAVEDWLASGKAFHVMRDFPTHSELVLAGMWGAHRGNLKGLGKQIIDYVRRQAGVLGQRGLDQRFLRDIAWPRMRGRTLTHDTYFQFGDARPFRDEFNLPFPMHVGQNDSVRFRRVGSQG